MMLNGNAPYPTRSPAKPAEHVHFQIKNLIFHKIGNEPLEQRYYHEENKIFWNKNNII